MGKDMSSLRELDKKVFSLTGDIIHGAVYIQGDYKVSAKMFQTIVGKHPGELIIFTGEILIYSNREFSIKLPVGCKVLFESSIRMRGVCYFQDMENARIEFRGDSSIQVRGEIKQSAIICEGTMSIDIEEGEGSGKITESLIKSSNRVAIASTNEIHSHSSVFTVTHQLGIHFFNTREVENKGLFATGLTSIFSSTVVGVNLRNIEKINWGFSPSAGPVMLSSFFDTKGEEFNFGIFSFTNVIAYFTSNGETLEAQDIPEVFLDWVISSPKGKRIFTILLEYLPSIEEKVFGMDLSKRAKRNLIEMDLKAD